MDRKIWVASPIFYIASVTVAVMALISLPFNMVLFSINLFVAMVSSALIYLNIRNFKSYIENTVNSAAMNLGEANGNFLQNIPIPTAIIGNKDEIVSYNDLFKDTIAKDRNLQGESVLQFLGSATMSDTISKDGLDIKYDGRNYIVYGVKFKNSTALYFIECTQYKQIKHEYLQSRPIIAFVLFDNMEELKRDCTDSQMSQILSSVESIIREWASETSGCIKKLNDGKFIMIFEERYISIFKSDKFKILNKIHDIKLDDRRFATISIGIGRGASNMLEAERWAQNALDMSLGRGGDQVAIKKGETYEFFGGTSKEVEKRSKVRTRVIASAFYQQMATSDMILITGHRFSDLDSIGAAVGVWSVATGIKGKEAYIVVDKETSLAASAIEKFQKNYEKPVFISPKKGKSMIKENTLLVVVDTHSANFLEDKDLCEKCKDVVVIDHHRMVVDHISDAVIFYHEPFASSASEMVTELVQYMDNKNLKKHEAECLLAGIMLDTKNFFMKTGVRTFEAATYLRKKGADTIEVKRMFSNSMETYKIKCRVINSVKVYGKFAIGRLDEATTDVAVACAQAADELLGVQDIKASFVVFPHNNQISISARAFGEINVQVIMEKLGGGGHQTMAASQLSGVSIQEAEEKLINVLKEFLTENEQGKSGS